MSAKPIERLPFWFGFVATHGLGDSCWMQVYNIETWGVLRNAAFSLGLPVEVVEFIYTHCKCRHCGAAIAKDLRRCKCGKPSKWSSAVHLEVVSHGKSALNQFLQMLRREELRMMSRHRYSRVKQAGGSFTKKDVAELLEVQEGLCYFCGGHINTGSRKDNLHADHYDPIANGGKNEVFNIVLTCPSCNITKGAMHGDRFEQIVKKTRDPDIGRNLGRIRSKLTRYRAQRRAATSHD